MPKGIHGMETVEDVVGEMEQPSNKVKRDPLKEVGNKNLGMPILHKFGAQ